MAAYLAYKANWPQWGAVICASLVAALIDVRHRRIPNGLTLPLLAMGLTVALAVGGIRGLGSAIAGCVVCALPYVLLFVYAGGGAGDAKMMGAVGSWLGLDVGVVALVCVAAVGGVFGLLRMIAHKDRKTLIGNLLASLYMVLAGVCMGRRGWELVKAQFQADQGGASPCLTIPYGVAILLGVCISALVVHPWST